MNCNFQGQNSVYLEALHSNLNLSLIILLLNSIYILADISKICIDSVKGAGKVYGRDVQCDRAPSSTGRNSARPLLLKHCVRTRFLIRTQSRISGRACKNIVGPHPQSSWVSKPGLRPKNLNFNKVHQVILNYSMRSTFLEKGKAIN